MDILGIVGVVNCCCSEGRVFKAHQVSFTRFLIGVTGMSHKI